METKLERIAEISAKTRKPEFTSLYHHINDGMLRQCHKELDGNKAVGIDRVTKTKYEVNLEENISNLVKRLKNKSYKPLPSLRVFIPKGNGKMRPLGIASYEDKMVQLAVKKILEAIYEPRFLRNMHGFRPRRGCHDAIKEVYNGMYHGKINYIVDSDIKGFFNHMSHEWIMKFLGVYIKDPNLLWLINKYLKAGVITEGVFEESTDGSAQGNIISPIIANIYMHNVLMLWYKIVITKETKGDSFLTVYADDFIAGFQYKWEAEKYYGELKKRMGKFNLEMEDSKSRLLEFGKFAEGNRKARGEGKPETFDFLGFTFYCGRSRRGYPCVMLQTSRKKFRQKLKDTKKWLYENRTMPVKEMIKALNLKLVGHYRYYGVSFNGKMITNFLHRVQQFLSKTLNRRSDKKSYSWDGYIEMLKYYPLAKPKIYFKLF
ncbi:group II intron reverse transcriptase/maturase [Clostridium pasteurianum]|uniref:Retron-type reverse transcriptase n=1 Tax=Clostridium pasteurianum BC1 TaxID=86416 RepID=R4K4K7_CLOPA|nr:group II intron reverse transcriptase/maturase [Clostridium pasteurianum]AGK95484.1 Retron-type reverse transcriptase [Clostridium pasteurianum BC1]AGK98611.1 Retron-type reverse transcriptase [Clostridium pasteurianum BC1]